jgi:hypothetical protein
LASIKRIKSGFGPEVANEQTSALVGPHVAGEIESVLTDPFDRVIVRFQNVLNPSGRGGWDSEPRQWNLLVFEPDPFGTQSGNEPHLLVRLSRWQRGTPCLVVDFSAGDVTRDLAAKDPLT